MAVTGTTGVDNITLTKAQANETVDLLGGADTLNLPATTTNLIVSNTETINGGSSADFVTLTNIPSGSTFSLGGGTDTLAFTGTNFDLRSSTLTSVERLQAGSTAATTFTVDTADLASGGCVTGSTSTDTLIINSSSFDLRSTTLTSVEVLQTNKNTATTFTVDAADLVSGGSVIGSSGSDTLTINGASLDLRNTTISSVEILRAGTASATTFTVDAADLVSGSSVIGSSGSDTLTVNSTAIDLTSTALSSLERITAGKSSATTFTIDVADLVSGSSVLGSSGSDTLIINNATSVDLRSTTLSSIESLNADNSNATTFTVDAADLASGGSVIGSTGSDTLTINSTAFDLRSTTLSSVESLKAANTNATTFTVDQADLASGGSVFGSTSNDTLTINATALDLTSTTLSSVEILRAGKNTATTITVDPTELVNNGSVIGSSGNDTLTINSTSYNLTSTTLSSVEILKTGVSNATTFTIDSADITGTGSIVGSSGIDTLIANNTALDLRSTTLTSVEVIQAGKSTATTFSVDQADLASGGSVIGSSGTDTLVSSGTGLDLSSTTLSSIENLAGTTATATTFIVDQDDLAVNGTITGTNKSDTLTVAGTAIDLSSTTVSSLDTIKAGTTSATTFTVDASDLVSGGCVTGSTGSDTLSIRGAALDLRSTTLNSVEILRAGTSNATTFTVDTSDLAASGSVVGGSSVDSLVMNSATFDLRSTVLSNVEVLKAGSASATTFTFDQADLIAGGSVFGSTGSDELRINGTSLDLRSTTLSSVETLRANTTDNTSFTVDQSDLSNAGTVRGNTGSDTLIAGGASLDLRSTTLTSVERLQAGTTADTTLTVDTGDLSSGGTVIGNSGSDTLQVNSTSVDLRSTTLNSVDVLQAGLNSATTFTVDIADLAADGSVIGSSGTDTLTINSTAFNLSSTTLSSVEKLTAVAGTATTFTLDQDDLAVNGTITGTTQNDILAAAGTSIDLSSTALSSINIIRAGTTSGTSFTVDASDLIASGSVIGSTGSDTLAGAGTALDLRSTVLSSVEALQAGSTSATTFTVDTADLASGGSVIGNAGNDTLTIGGTAFDLRSTTLSSLEILKTGVTTATTFTVDAEDMVAGGSVLGSTSNDTLLVGGTSVDLSSTALSSVEIIKAGTTNATTFTIDTADLSANGSVLGSTGVDTLAAGGATLDTTTTTLSSVEILKVGTTTAATLTVDAADLASNGSVLGNAGNDTLTLKSTAFDLSSTTLSSIDVLKAGLATATTFTADSGDLAPGGSVLGSTGTDTLTVKGTAFDISNTTLSNVEILKAGTTAATTFTVDTADLAANGSVLGSSGSDTLAAGSASLDLTSTTLSSVEALKTSSTNDTSFTVDTADLTSGGSVTGNSGNDTLTLKSTAFDLRSTTLSSIEALKAGIASATTFTVDSADLVSGGSVLGNSGNDTLTITSTSFDLGNTTVSSVEKLQAGSASATTFKVDTEDLAAGGSVLGSTGNDTLLADSTLLDLTSTALSSIEILKAGVASATTFDVDAADLVSGGSVIGSTGNDTLLANGTALDTSNTTLSSVEILSAGSTADTTFTVTSADLASGGSVLGNAGDDTLSVKSTGFDLSNTTLSSVEILEAGATAATTFTVNAADLASGGSVIGNAGNDTLAVSGTLLDLSDTTLSSVEKLQAGSASATTFNVDVADLINGGSVIGSTGNDTLTTSGTALDLANTALSNVEILQAGSTAATTFTADAADLAAGGSVLGNSGNDTLTIRSTAADLTSTTLSSVEMLKAGSAVATTFTVDAADLATVGTVIGSTGKDTLTFTTTAFDLTSTVLSSVEALKAGSTAGTTITVDSSDLASGGSVFGNTGTDTLVTADNTLDLTNTVISSIETLKAGSTNDTQFILHKNLGEPSDIVGTVLGNSGDDALVGNATGIPTSSTLDITGMVLSSVEIIKTINAGTQSTSFIVEQSQLASGGSVIGDVGATTLTIAGAALDLRSTTLSSIEALNAGSASATTFTVDQADLVDGSSVFGNGGTDTLAAAGTELDLSGTTVSSVEILKAGTAAATTFTADTADLASGGSVLGNAGTDTLVVAAAALDTSNTTLSSIEILKAGATLDTTFTVTQGDLAAGGSVLGNTGNDTLQAGGATLDLSSTTLSGVEALKAGTPAATQFTVDSADLAVIGAVQGAAGTDTLTIKSTSFDLTGTTLSSVEVLKAGTTGNTTFSVDAADLAPGGSVLGSSGTDTLLAGSTALDVSNTTLSSVEVLKAGSTNDTTFTVDSGSLAVGGSVVGSSGSDTLTASGTALDLRSTTLSSVESLTAGNSSATTFTVDVADLAAGGSVTGNDGSDTLVAAGTALNLASTTLSGVETLKAGSAAATTFTVDQDDLAESGTIAGSTGNDTLAAAGTSLDLSFTELASVETLKAGSAAATSLVVDQSDLAKGGSVIGSSGNDALATNGSQLDLSSTTLSSVETLQSANAAPTTFIVDQADLASGGSVQGNLGTDTLTAAGTSLDLSNTALNSIEVIKLGNAANSSLTVDQGDLAANGTVLGNNGNDTLTVNGTGVDLTSTALSNVEILKAGSGSATSFTIDQNDLTLGGSVLGGAGSDTLSIAGNSFDLRSASLSSVEILKAGSSDGTTFAVDPTDLVAGGSVLGSTGSDILVATGTALDLSSTTLSSVDVLQAGATNATTITVDQADLAVGGSVVGDTGSDTLAFKSTAADLTSTSLDGVEILRAGNAGATSLKVDQADLASGGSVIGNSGSDTLLAGGTLIDLSHTTLSSVETIKAGTAGDTTFAVDTADLTAGGSVIGSSGTDTLAAGSSQLDLSSTTLSSVEVIKAGTDDDSNIIVDASDLASGGSVIGGAGGDTLIVNGTSFDLSGTSISGIEKLKAGSAAGTSFKLDSTDLDGVAVSGSTGTDALVAAGTSLDLGNTSLNSVEIIKAGTAGATTFAIDQGDLAAGGSVIGSTGTDTLAVNTGSIDLGSTALSSVEVLKSTGTVDTSFTVDQGDLAAGGSIIGNSGSDTIEVIGTSIDLTSTTLSGVELLQAGPNGATTFTVDSADLAGGLDVSGGLGNDILTVKGTSVDLSSSAISSVEMIKAGSSNATTFKVDQADLTSDPAFDGIIQGSSGTDTLIGNGTSLDLRSTTVSSVEIIKAGTNSDTTFFLDVGDLVPGGQVIGGAGNDTLILNATSLNLNGATLTSIETVKLGATSDTLFVLTDADLKSKTTLQAGLGTDTVQFNGTNFNLTSLTLSGIEILRAGTSNATTFTVDQADLAAGGVVRGSTGNDILAINGTSLDLTSTSLNSVEVLKAGTNVATTFKVNQSDLLNGGSVIGGSGNDTLTTDATSLDLRSTTLSSLETVKAGSTADTTFTIDQADLTGRTFVGNAGTDSIAVKGTSADFGLATLSGVEVIKASSAANTTFFVDQADLAKNGAVQGSSGSDSLAAIASQIDLRSTTLDSVEIIKTGKGVTTTFLVDQSDLLVGGSVQGAGGSDTLMTSGTSLDLTNTTLTSVDNIAAGRSTDTTFTVNPGDLLPGGTVRGSTGTDTLVVKNASFDLSSTTLNNVEVLKAGSSNDTTFKVDQLDLAKNGTVSGSSGNDALASAATTIDLGSTTLNNVETIKAGLSVATTFVVDQDDLLAGGNVQGSTGADTLAIRATSLDLTSTTLNSVETIKANVVGATTFKVDQADLLAGGNVQGNSGNDTLSINGTSLNLGSTTLKSVEIIKAGTGGDTTITVDKTDLASGASVIGNSGTDTLIINGTAFDLTTSSVSSIEILKAGSTADTTFTVNQADLNPGGVVQGTAKTDTLAIGGSSLDLTSTTISGVEVIKAGTAGMTTITVDAADLAAGGSVIGSTANDTLVVKDANYDLTGTTLTSVENLKAGVSTATTFTVDQADMAGLKSVTGSSGADTLTVNSTAFDLSSVTLTSVEVLKSGTHLSTTFTVNQADLLPGGIVQGSTATDTLLVLGSGADLRSTTLTSVETIKAAASTGTSFTVDAADLAPGGAFQGNKGIDTLTVLGTAFDVSSTALSSIEVLKASSNSPTTFTTDLADLAAGGSVIGGTANDTLTLAGTAINLSSTNLSSIEILKSGSTNASTFTVDQTDLAKNGSLVGGGQDDSLAAAGTALDLRSTVLTSVEILKAGSTTATTWTVDQQDLVAAGSVMGNSGIDRLAGSSLDLTSTTLSSVEILQTSAVMKIDQVDLVAGGTVQGSSGSDALQISGTLLDLSSTTLNSVEALQAGTNSATIFRVDQADLAKGGLVKGGSANDTLAIVGSQLDLASTTLSGVEIIRAGTNAATTFIVDQADLAAQSSVIGSSASDTLMAASTALDLRSTTLSSIETIKAGGTMATIFTVDSVDVAATNVIGGVGSDTLTINGTAFDLTSTILSSVETLKANAAGTTFTVDQIDLAVNGVVMGTTGTDTLATSGTLLDLGSTALNSVEVLKAGTAGDTTFRVNQADLLANGTVAGNSGTDTLAIAGTSLDLSSTALNSVEVIEAGLAAPTSFTVNTNDLVVGGSVLGSTGSDTLIAKDTLLDLRSTTLSSVEILKAGAPAASTFAVDQDDLAANGSVLGGAVGDTLMINGTTFDLTSTVLSSVEILKAGTTGATTFNLDQGDLGASGTVMGGAGTDTLIIKGTSAFLGSTALSSVEILKAGSAAATTFTVDQADLVAGGSVLGGAGIDTLVGLSATLNLSSTTLSKIEVIKANGATTLFTVDQADLAAGGSVIGGIGSDTLMVTGVAADLTNSTLTSIETLKASVSTATTFTVKQANLAFKGSVIGSSGDDTLVTIESSLNLGSTALSSVEIIKAGANSATVFSVDQTDLATKGSVLGNSDIDTLTTLGSSLDLRSTTLSSVEILKVGTAVSTQLTVDQADLAAGGAVIGSSGTDQLIAGGTLLDLTGSSLSSIEVIRSGTVTATTFVIDQADLADKGSLIGGGGSDTLTISGASLDLRGTTLTSVEILKTADSTGTTFIVDQSDLAVKGSILGGAGDDTLTINGTSFDLRSTTISSIDILQAGASTATTFLVDQDDLVAAGSVVGDSGNDTLMTLATTLDLTSTTLTSVEALKAGSGSSTIFTVNAGDLAASVLGNTGTDTLLIKGTSFDLTALTLSSVEILKGDSAGATTFKVDMADLAVKGLVLGGSAVDTLILSGTNFDLANTTLSSIEMLRTLATDATVFALDQADLAANGTIIGGSGVDTLAAKGTSFDLSSTTLNSVEIIKSTLAAATTFTINDLDLLSGGSVFGGTGSDSLVFKDTDADLTGTTLSSIEILRAGSSSATSFTLDQGDLIATGTIFGSTGSDSLTIDGTSLDLRSTTLVSIEHLKAGTASDTVFTLDQTDLITGMTISGSTGIDTLQASSGLMDLRSTALTSIEIIKSNPTIATTFIVDQADLVAGGSVIGSNGNDILRTHGSLFDLTSTTLSGIEVISANGTANTTFVLDDGSAGLSITGVFSTFDTFKFVGNYGLTDVSDDNTILADTATITNFNTNGNEIIDVSALTANGNATFHSQATTQLAVNTADPTVLKDALDAAASAIDGSTNSVVTSFVYGGATYVLVDNSSGPGLTTDDVVIKLSGSITLTASEFTL